MPLLSLKRSDRPASGPAAQPDAAGDAAPPAGTPPRDAEKILQRVDWTIVRRLYGLLQGEYRSLFYGHGLDLAEVREYQPEDDIRYMDWNVTARMNAPHVRQYLEDREVTEIGRASCRERV